MCFECVFSVLREGSAKGTCYRLLAEALSSLFQVAQDNGIFRGISASRGGPQISHLFFADDNVIFGDVVPPQAAEVRRILKDYEAASGQKVNLDKSIVVFSRNTTVQVRDEITTILGVVESKKHGKYLGLLAVMGKSKKEVLAHIQERVRKNVKGWKEKLLSKAGKEVLIKAVAQACPTCVMSCFKLPNGVGDDLIALISNFWWSSNVNSKGMKWVSWNKLCKPKNEGD